MVRFAESGTCQGFIRDVTLNAQNSLSVQDLTNFKNLSSDEARYKFVANIEFPKESRFTLKKVTVKSHEAAMAFKKAGNGAFQQKNWTNAVDLYSKGLMVLPPEHREYNI